jgi:hypothetical protein
MPAGALVSVLQGKIDIALSQFARLYRNNEFIAESLFPRVEVTNQSDLFWQFGRENQKLAENTLRGPGSAAERIKQTISNTRYACPDHALARLIPDEERKNFQAGDVEQWATRAIMDKLMLDKENQVAAIAAATANYAAGMTVTLAGTAQWSDQTSLSGTNILPYTISDPVSDIETAKAAVRKTGKRPNLLVLGDAVFQKLATHPRLVGRFQYTQPQTLSTDQLAAVFGIDKVIVGSAVSLDATDTAQFVWGKIAVVAYVEPNASMEDVSFGKTFVWSDAPGTVGGFGTEIGRMDPPSAKADELAVHFYYGLQVTSNVSAYLIKNAVA